MDTSLYETALAYIGYHLVGYLADGTVPTGQGTVFPMVAPYQVLPTGDGELMVAGGNDRLYAAICDVVGLPELVSDPRFTTNPDRVRNRDELVAILSERLREETTRHWHEALREAGVPAAPVSNVEDVVMANQTEALGLFQRLEHPRIPDLELVALPVSFDRERSTHRSAPPVVGQHTAEILRELGYAEDDIEELAVLGIVRVGEE